jgi:hypothetical protein
MNYLTDVSGQLFPIFHFYNQCALLTVSGNPLGYNDGITCLALIVWHQDA